MAVTVTAAPQPSDVPDADLEFEAPLAGAGAGEGPEAGVPGELTWSESCVPSAIGPLVCAGQEPGGLRGEF